MTETRIEVRDGKYGVILRERHASSTLRYGEQVGLPTNREYWLAIEVRDLRAEVATLRGRRDELLATANKYLFRARAAERMLRLFRLFVLRNATQWVRGAGHQHPIWAAGADILRQVGGDYQFDSRVERRFLSLDNTRPLADLESDG